MSRGKVVVGMSGGVDSSVAAWVLKRQGYEVVGLFMKNWEDDDTDDYCTSRVDLVDAASVADVIGIDLEAVNFAAEYRERVFAEFLREYAAGRTPNPDVLCNSEIKFRAFLDHARTLGADWIATGHYARTRRTGARVELLKAVDGTKDQSYFLHRLTQAQLAPVLFPLGEMRKHDVRAIARREGIPTWAKKDSTG
ncbi:MAG: tRNA 2-thiouridine(34) synthase MnmA, partial [Casimicrobiaceae bacterium]